MEQTKFGHKKQNVTQVTGADGLSVCHISKRLLDESWRVVGFDYMSNYYDVSLKERCQSVFLKNSVHRSVHEKVEDPNALIDIFGEEKPDVFIHLAAEAGVRYLIENVQSYINGTFELLEVVRARSPEHMLLA